MPALKDTRFKSIEGLRAWLAMAVVVAHVTQFSGHLVEFGTVSVLIFIIVSGFVITHLVVTRPERYAEYITRRVFRIAPVFAVCCVMGAVTLAPDLPRFAWSPAILPDLKATQHNHFWHHVVAHATMLHGAISNNLLPLSQYAFLPPAWSLSLEWQFYLLAPFVVLAPQKLVLCCAVCVTGWLYSKGVFGSFRNPSLIFGAGIYFLVGITSRLVLPRILNTVAAPVSIAAGLACLYLISPMLLPIAIWGAFLALLCTDQQIVTGLEARYTNLVNSLLTHRYSLWVGQRSYSIYLCHFAVMLAVNQFLWTLNPHMGRFAYATVLAAISIPLTLALSAALYRWVEEPGIVAGRVIAARITTLLASRYRGAA